MSSSSWFRVRLLPVTIVVAVMMLGVKLGDINEDRIAISQALAEGEESTDKKDTPAKDDTAKAEEKTSAEPQKQPEAESETTKKDTATTEAEPAAPATTDEKNAASTEKTEEQRQFSQMEIDLLQTLSKRREEIEKWAEEVELKETMLNATEQRINDKIVEIKDLKKQVDTLLAKYDEREDTKIRSLVKIYENMKPKEAASIFEELEMPILLLVVDRMSERKVAPVLANMSPKKAMQVTTELAEQRRLHKPPVAPTETLDTAPVTGLSPKQEAN